MPSRCTATAKSTGKQCGRLAHPGATVCVKHGAATPQVRAAARRRVAEQSALQWASQQLARDGMPERTPLEHLEAVLEQDARTFALWDAACSLLVDEGSTLLGFNKHGEQLIHPYVDERNKAATRWARSSKYALDAGVSQKRVEIEQQRAELMAATFRAVLGMLAREFGHGPDFQQRGLHLLGAELRRHGPAELPAA